MSMIKTNEMRGINCFCELSYLNKKYENVEAVCQYFSEYKVFIKLWLIKHCVCRTFRVNFSIVEASPTLKFK